MTKRKGQRASRVRRLVLGVMRDVPSAHDLPSPTVLPSRHQENFDFRCVNKASRLDTVLVFQHLPSSQGFGSSFEGYKKGRQGRCKLLCSQTSDRKQAKLQRLSSQSLFSSSQTNKKPYTHFHQYQWPTPPSKPPPRRRASAPASTPCSPTSAPSVSAWRTNVRWNKTFAPNLPSRRNSRLSDDDAVLTAVALRLDVSSSISTIALHQFHYNITMTA